MNDHYVQAGFGGRPDYPKGDGAKENKNWQPSRSRGSSQHVTGTVGTCKPCAWSWKLRGCLQGSSCDDCHLCGPEEYRQYRKNRLKGLKVKRKQDVARRKEEQQCHEASQSSAPS